MDRLPDDVVRRILARLAGLETDPRPADVKKLKGREAWQIRVGDYRVIYEIHDRVLQVIVIILAILHQTKDGRTRIISPRHEAEGEAPAREVLSRLAFGDVQVAPDPVDGADPGRAEAGGGQGDRADRAVLVPLGGARHGGHRADIGRHVELRPGKCADGQLGRPDRKSTRLNSSHRT